MSTHMSNYEDEEEEDANNYYEVERILDMSIADDGERYFLIKWKGFDESTVLF